MTIEFHCNDCDKLLRTDDSKAGMSANCPGCGAPVIVPSISPAPPPPTSSSDAFVDDSPYTFESASASTAGNEKPCPVCGAMIKIKAIRCRYCGENFGDVAATGGSPNAFLKPHRGGLILGLSLAGWLFCALFSIAAWIMGHSDMKEIDAGRMAPEGRSMTQAGKIIGMIQTVLLLVGLLFFCVIMVLGGVGGALEQM